MITTKLAITAAAVALAAGGAAAAAGALSPAEPAADGIAEANEHIGDNLPDAAADEARQATGDAGADEADAATDDGAQATESESIEDDDAELGNTDNPTDADAHGEAVSAVATDTELTGRDKGEAVSNTARGDAGAEAGASSDAAPVDTPNHGSASDRPDAP